MASYVADQKLTPVVNTFQHDPNCLVFGPLKDDLVLPKGQWIADN